MAPDRPPPVPVVVRLGVRVTPPPGGDCTCVSCALYRAGHKLRRAVLLSAAAPLPFLLAWWAGPAATSTGVGYGSQVVGGLLLVGTVAVVLALSAWSAPGRRALHRRRPRSLSWPPE
ncbi:hypothetical protein K6U06_04280 [Acidiferrimicrobium sp. IK]|uniref:hypothetical protein n=1 Tax=Acidiferrimicrobium sp. IK TaxID=2871700 RepID=UPI0021CB8F66|nr:hypothetical protein [Acidiferrimicrobium sp. IK]MCU4183565.1 hypothetical protein [Acidiferrimicrobium sp. IK]